MQKVCDLLEKLLAEGGIQKYAIGGATAAGFHGEPLAAIAMAVGRPKDRARLVYLFSLQNFNKGKFADIIQCHGLSETWLVWAKGLGLLEV